MEPRSNLEIDEGAVLVVAGEHKNRVGFYCLQNEQTYDLRILSNCPNCEFSKGKLTKVSTNLNKSETLFHAPIEIETGAYCKIHLKALIDHEMAVVYWDKPYGNEYALIHARDLVQIPSTEYARYEIQCKTDSTEALSKLLESLKEF